MMIGEKLWKMHNEHLLKLWERTKKLLLVKSKSKWLWTRFLHPAPYNHCSWIIYEGFWKITAKMPPEAWYKMYVKPWHPEWAILGICVLSRVISASASERNWSTHWLGHIQSKISNKISNKLSPETTEKLVYVCLNSKMAANVSYADKLKMFAWDNEDV